MSEKRKNKFDGWDVWELGVQIILFIGLAAFSIKLFSLILF